MPTTKNPLKYVELQQRRNNDDNNDVDLNTIKKNRGISTVTTAPLVLAHWPTLLVASCQL
jgi:hypothetical protein